MPDRSISKDRFPDLIAAVCDGHAVYGPKAEEGVIAFRPISCADELAMGYRNSTISPKQLFLPRAEVVYELDGDQFLDDSLPEEKIVIFGLRPCDCRALTLLDRVFDTEQVKDPFYLARRENTVLVALACNRPLSTCFCTALGGDPFGEEGVDVLLADAGEELLVRALTPRGEGLLECCGEVLSKGAGDWDGLAKEARGKLRADLAVDGLQACLDGKFENNVWGAVSRKCLGCGACSCLCPTCYCFDLMDEPTPTGVRKVRRSDCCMFPSFTLHASGHNPRAVNSARMRQKIMHKFSYFTQRYDVNGCVGCGRCVRSCPVNLDIRQLLDQVVAAPDSVAEK